MLDTYCLKAIANVTMLYNSDDWRSSKVAAPRADTVLPLCFNVAMSSWHSSILPCWWHLTSRDAAICACRLRQPYSFCLFGDQTPLGDHSFFVATPEAWSLPSAVWAAPSLITFRRELKRFLFCVSFVDHWVDLTHHASPAVPIWLCKMCLQR